MSKIEEVARAIGGDVWESCSDRMKEQFRAQARAAIEAMREPTHDMLAAGDSMMPQIAPGQDISTGVDALADAWPAMISAALAEGPKDAA